MKTRWKNFFGKAAETYKTENRRQDDIASAHHAPTSLAERVLFYACKWTGAEPNQRHYEKPPCKTQTRGADGNRGRRDAYRPGVCSIYR